MASVERPSTTMISVTHSGTAASTDGRLSSSFSVGITNDTVGEGRRERVRLLDAFRTLDTIVD